MNKIVLLSLLLLSQLVVKSQNLDKMPQSERDAYLTTTAKEVVLKYGPGYYRKYRTPIIEKEVLTEAKTRDTEYANDIGRVFYSVTYPYDRTKERLEMNFAAEVYIWGDTGHPISVFFGNGIGIEIRKTKSSLKQIPYQALRPIEIIDLNN